MTLRRRYIFSTTVSSVQEKTEKVYIKGAGADTEFEERSLGWFVGIGHNMVIPVGAEKPAVRVGQEAKFIVEI